MGRIIDVNGNPLSRKASSYTHAGAGFGGQLAQWNPSLKSADAALLPQLDAANARSDDVRRNNAMARGGVQLHIDNMVGNLFRPSYKLNWRALGMEEASARAFIREAEQAFIEYGEDPGCYIDAERKRTFTMLCRSITGSHVNYGEGMACFEWAPDRPSLFNMCVKLVSPKRVSNPRSQHNTNTLRSGVAIDRHGAAQGYWVEESDYSEYGMQPANKWSFVQRETAWGRTQFAHVFEPSEPGQSRGENLFLTVMSQLHSLDKLQQTKLQNAIVNAMYAATIESELDSEQAFQLISGGQDTVKNLQNWMVQLADYHDSANIKMNGVKIPHLMPGESLNLTHPSNSDNGFSDLETSILRYIAAGLGLSYEQLARDFSKVNYSSARASINESHRYFMGKRKVIPSRFASIVFANWLEEALHRKILVPPKSRFNFYERRAAWTNVTWIGQGKLAIDGLKEVKEAILRIEGRLSTYEDELALMGKDYQEVFEQQYRELQEIQRLGLPTPSWAQMGALTQDTSTNE